MWPFSLFRKEVVMSDYQIIRIASSGKGTFGVLLQGNEPICLTCEDPWSDNKKNESCIPAGTYKVVKRQSPKYGHHWHVLDVEGRALILIHFGNNINDTQGCILVGRSFGQWEGLPSVMTSQDTMTILRGKLPDSFSLTIKECYS